MIQIGNFNRLQVLDIAAEGVLLDGLEDGEICLPARMAPDHCRSGDFLDVFVYCDSEDRLVATTETPFATVGEFAALQVVSKEPFGAFLDWGLPKELFLPFREQTREIRVGQIVVVFIYLDKSARISASMRVEKYVDRTRPDFHEGDEVDLLITNQTDLGHKALVNGRYLGILYANEVFQKLEYGENRPGFIKKIREDGKIDLSLARTGHEGSKDVGASLLDLLEKEGGFFPVNDTSSTETIYDLLGVSKKKFKMAVGGLLKKKLIAFEKNGIKLVT